MVLAVLALAVLLRRRTSYQSHLQQLGVNRKPKRQLVVGSWTREEVAQHSKEDDLWLIIQVRAACCKQGLQQQHQQRQQWLGALGRWCCTWNRPEGNTTGATATSPTSTDSIVCRALCYVMTAGVKAAIDVDQGWVSHSSMCSFFTRHACPTHSRAQHDALFTGCACRSPHSSLPPPPPDRPACCAVRRIKTTAAGRCMI